MLYSNKLKYLRERNGYTQKQIGQLINVDDGTYENEKILIPLKHLNTICNYFNVSLDYIFNFTNEPYYPHSTLNINKAISIIRLKELRHKYNLTQNMLAKKLNVSRSTISEYE